METEIVVSTLEELNNLSQKDLPNVTIVDLSCQNLTSFPDKILGMKNLIHFSLEGNFITKIPDLKLPKLETIHLTCNHISEFGDLDLPNLDCCFIKGNPIKKIGNFKMPKLTKFYCNVLPNPNNKNIFSQEVKGNCNYSSLFLREDGKIVLEDFCVSLVSILKKEYSEEYPIEWDIKHCFPTFAKKFL